MDGFKQRRSMVFRYNINDVWFFLAGFSFGFPLGFPLGFPWVSFGFSCIMTSSFGFSRYSSTSQFGTALVNLTPSLRFGLLLLLVLVLVLVLDSGVVGLLSISCDTRPIHSVDLTLCVPLLICRLNCIG